MGFWEEGRASARVDRNEKLKSMMGISLLERCTNKEIRKSAGVKGIVESFREARMKWLGHVVRREEILMMQST